MKANWWINYDEE